MNAMGEQETEPRPRMPVVPARSGQTARMWIARCVCAASRIRCCLEGEESKTKERASLE